MIGAVLRRRRVVGGVVIGVLACVVIGAVVIDRASPKAHVCAGIGIIDAPTASSPDAALAAYLATRGGDAAEWKRGDHHATVPDRAMGVAPYESYDFTPARAVSGPDFELITVRGRAGIWSTSGACVAASDTRK